MGIRNNIEDVDLSFHDDVYRKYNIDKTKQKEHESNRVNHIETEEEAEMRYAFGHCAKPYGRGI